MSRHWINMPISKWLFYGSFLLCSYDKHYNRRLTQPQSVASAFYVNIQQWMQRYCHLLLHNIWRKCKINIITDQLWVTTAQRHETKKWTLLLKFLNWAWAIIPYVFFNSTFVVKKNSSIKAAMNIAISLFSSHFATALLSPARFTIAWSASEDNDNVVTGASLFLFRSHWCVRSVSIAVSWGY